MLDRCGLACLGNYLLGCRNRLLLLALGQMGGAFPRFINHFLPVRVGSRENFLVTLLGFGEFLLYFFRVDLALFDLSPALFQQSKDRFVSEALQKERNNAEPNDLRQKQLPVPAEHFSCLTHNVADASAGGGKYRYHKINSFMRSGEFARPQQTICWATGRGRRTRWPRLTRWREFRARAPA